MAPLTDTSSRSSLAKPTTFAVLFVLIVPGHVAEHQKAMDPAGLSEQVNVTLDTYCGPKGQTYDPGTVDSLTAVASTAPSSLSPFTR